VISLEVPTIKTESPVLAISIPPPAVTFALLTRVKVPSVLISISHS